MQREAALSTAVELVKAPLLYKGKVRELYDLGEHMLIVVTDRISAFDYVLEPPIPGKGKVLNQLSCFWFEQTEPIISNHLVHADVDQLEDGVVTDREALRDRIMVVKKAERIDVECVVRGYITGNGWRQYEKSGQVNGHRLREGLRKNERLSEPIFTPAAKNDVGHDEDITIEEMAQQIGSEMTNRLQQKSIELYNFAVNECEKKGIILADCKFEFGIIDGELILIDEIFTPDASRFWSKEDYKLDVEINSMDKEPVRHYLFHSDWDQNSVPDPLPPNVVQETSDRYQAIFQRITRGTKWLKIDDRIGGNEKMLKATVYVTIKESVLDPQGNAVQGALHSMGFQEVEEVRIGKSMELKLNTTDRQEAEARLREMCEKLLTNPVIEDYRYELEVISS